MDIESTVNNFLETFKDLAASNRELAESNRHLAGMMEAMNGVAAPEAEKPKTKPPKTPSNKKEPKVVGEAEPTVESIRLRLKDLDRAVARGLVNKYASKLPDIDAANLPKLDADITKALNQ